MASRDLYSRIALMVLYMYFCCLSSIQAHDQDCDEFNVQPQDVVASAGGMAMMKCEYTGLAVEWDKEGYSIIYPCMMSPVTVMSWRMVPYISTMCQDRMRESTPVWPKWGLQQHGEFSFSLDS